MITIFTNFSDTKNPRLVEIDEILERIKNCTLQPKIDAIRAESDEKIKKDLKKMLPCILFSGEFTERKDKAIVKHSGFVVLDWDHLENLEEKRAEICDYHFIYSCFISPSGDGLKAVVRIPAIIEKHRGYYAGLMRLFPDLDATSINESRICYASADANIFINKNATEFTDYVDIKALQQTPINVLNSKSTTDSSKPERALKIIRESIDGEKHASLLRASRLMGGYVAGGLISENDASELLEREIGLRGCDDIKAAQITIKKGLNHGKTNPIVADEKINQEYVSKTQSKISVEDDDFSFIASEEEIDEYIQQWVDGTFVKGLTTGLPSFDKYFLYKRGNFNVVNGFDNVGKSTALWYLCLLSAMYHGWNWVLYSNENRAGTVRKKLIEFYWGKPINKLSDSQLKQGKEFAKKHFTIIGNKSMYNYKDILNIAKKISNTKQVDGLLVDPYNSLKIELSNNSKLSTHEYHYEAASEMQLFAKQEDMCVYLNCHVITGSMRLKHGETKHSAPGKADTEGGGKFSNKADDFMTFHREVQDSANYTKMQIHVRKIKEIETGGGYTPYDQPFILEMQRGMCSYADENGVDPVYEYWHKKNKQITLIPDQNFLHDQGIMNYEGDDHPF